MFRRGAPHFQVSKDFRGIGTLSSPAAHPGSHGFLYEISSEQLLFSQQRRTASAFSRMRNQVRTYNVYHVTKSNHVVGIIDRTALAERPEFKAPLGPALLFYLVS